MSTVAVASAFAVVVGGAFAFFNDTADFSEQVNVGTVDINVTGDLLHSNALNNLNPGDNDPTVPKDFRGGTDHELMFEVENNGSKSIITRAIIKISGTDNQNRSLAAYQLEQTIAVILAEKTNGTAFDDSRLPKDRNDIIPLKATGYNEDYDHNIHELVFIVGDNDDWVLNGSEEKETGIDATTLAKSFEVGLAKEVQDEDYQGANLKITVEIQAMQYRNTGSEVWDTIFTESFDISGLPSENENG